METIKRIDESSVEIDGKVYEVRKEKSLQGETKFKTPCWVIADSAVKPSPIYVVKQSGNELRVSEDTFIDCRIVRLCTPNEIKNHLRKICDEKYIGKRVRSLFESKEGVVLGFYDYGYEEDWMWYDTGEYSLLVYEKGQWATILPDKKKLPKTKAEFVLFQQAWLDSDFAYSDFLDQYDFE